MLPFVPCKSGSMRIQQQFKRLLPHVRTWFFNQAAQMERALTTFGGDLTVWAVWAAGILIEIRQGVLPNPHVKPPGLWKYPRLNISLNSSLTSEFIGPWKKGTNNIINIFDHSNAFTIPRKVMGETLNVSQITFVMQRIACAYAAVAFCHTFPVWGWDGCGLQWSLCSVFRSMVCHFRYY